jgi:hypothetical protein
VPAKEPRTVSGIFSRCCISSTSRTASLIDMLVARLNDTVTDGNELVWLITSGVVLACGLRHRGQRNHALAGRIQVDVLQPFRALPVRRRHFQHHVILVELGVDDGNLGLAKGAVERAVERCRVMPSRAAVERS